MSDSNPDRQGQVPDDPSDPSNSSDASSNANNGNGNAPPPPFPFAQFFAHPNAAGQLPHGHAINVDPNDPMFHGLLAGVEGIVGQVLGGLFNGGMGGGEHDEEDGDDEEEDMNVDHDHAPSANDAQPPQQGQHPAGPQVRRFTTQGPGGLTEHIFVDLVMSAHPHPHPQPAPPPAAGGDPQPAPAPHPNTVYDSLELAGNMFDLPVLHTEEFSDSEFGDEDDHDHEDLPGLIPFSRDSTRSPSPQQAAAVPPSLPNTAPSANPQPAPHVHTHTHTQPDGTQVQHRVYHTPGGPVMSVTLTSAAFGQHMPMPNAPAGPTLPHGPALDPGVEEDELDDPPLPDLLPLGPREGPTHALHGHPLPLPQLQQPEGDQLTPEQRQLQHLQTLQRRQQVLGQARAALAHMRDLAQRGPGIGGGTAAHGPVLDIFGPPPGEPAHPGVAIGAGLGPLPPNVHPPMLPGFAAFLNQHNIPLHAINLNLPALFGPPPPDWERAKTLLTALERVPEGLVRRLDRVDGEGGGGKCAVCWGRLGERAEVDDEGEGEAEGEGGERRPKCPVEEDAVLSLPCTHTLHAVCLYPWLATHTTCPVCRFDLDPDSLTLRRTRPRTTTAPTAPPPPGMFHLHPGAFMDGLVEGIAFGAGNLPGPPPPVGPTVPRTNAEAANAQHQHHHQHQHQHQHLPHQQQQHVQFPEALAQGIVRSMTRLFEDLSRPQQSPTVNPPAGNAPPPANPAPAPAPAPAGPRVQRPTVPLPVRAGGAGGPRMVARSVDAMIILGGPQGPVGIPLPSGGGPPGPGPVPIPIPIPGGSRAGSSAAPLPPHPPAAAAAAQPTPSARPAGASRPLKRKYTLPSGSQTLRERIAHLEERAGLRCSDPSCAFAPTDDDLPADDSDNGKDTPAGPLPATYALEGGSCPHKFHASCLVTACRVRGERPEVEDMGTRVKVTCPVCRGGEGVGAWGWIEESAWEEGEVEGDV